MAAFGRRAALPRVFEAYVGGWLGPSFRVRFDGKKLDYQSLGCRGAEIEWKP